MPVSLLTGLQRARPHPTANRRPGPGDLVIPSPWNRYRTALRGLVDTLDLARRCRAIIWANFAGTLLVDGAGVGLAAVGLLNPMVAAFIHVASELVFLLNAARLLPGGRPGSVRAPTRVSRRDRLATGPGPERAGRRRPSSAR